ncbi:biotin transporter BioY [Proteiniclasticum sp. C24MP]|uniref:biotin transporter BioY n=1 Tax=Proteiniclasticum sp. C24MP TaxID=3374101 RepID=UPI003754C4C0
MNETALRKISTRDLAIIPIFSVLTAVGAFIRIPIGVVPVSLQTVFVVISALILGRKAFYAQLIYVLLGLMGLPVFTGGGGIGYIFTPTFGYLLGFMAAASIMGALRERLERIGFFRLALIALLGLVVIYGFGVSYLYLLKNLILTGTPMALYDAIRYGALLFLPMDTLWCLFGALLSERLLRHPYFSRR